MNHPAEWLTWTPIKPGLSVVAVTVVTGLATIFLRHLAKAGSSPLKIGDYESQDLCFGIELVLAALIFAWPGLVSRTLAVQVVALCLVAALAIVTHLRLDGWRYGELTTAGLVGANVTGAAVVMYAVVATVG